MSNPLYKEPLLSKIDRHLFSDCDKCIRVRMVIVVIGILLLGLNLIF